MTGVNLRRSYYEVSYNHPGFHEFPTLPVMPRILRNLIVQREDNLLTGVRMLSALFIGV